MGAAYGATLFWSRPPVQSPWGSHPPQKQVAHTWPVYAPSVNNVDCVPNMAQHISTLAAFDPESSNQVCIRCAQAFMQAIGPNEPLEMDSTPGSSSAGPI